MEIRSFDRINAELRRVAGCGERSADWKSAIRQVGNLRYELRRGEDPDESDAPALRRAGTARPTSLQLREPALE